jgi:hypothetical protein
LRCVPSPNSTLTTPDVIAMAFVSPAAG